MDPAKYARIFLEESREHLTLINQQLLEWERTPDADGPLTAIFRSRRDVSAKAFRSSDSFTATIETHT